MPRTNLTSGQITALQAPLVRPAIFVSIQFADGTYYLWSGVGSISWGGNTWLGIGTLGSVSVIEDGTSVEAKGISLTMSGIDPAMLEHALQNMQVGLPAAVYLGLLDGSNSLTGTPFPLWVGRTDQPTFDIGGEFATISINCENRLMEMDVACELRYTQEQQQADYPGDLGMQFVMSLQEINILWGTTVSTNNL